VQEVVTARAGLTQQLRIDVAADEEGGNSERAAIDPPWDWLDRPLSTDRGCRRRVVLPIMPDRWQGRDLRRALHRIVRNSPTATTGYAVDGRCPFDCDVGNGLIGSGEQVETSFSAAELYLPDEDPAASKTYDAKLTNVVVRRWPMYVIVEEEPAVEKRPQTIAPDLDGNSSLGRSRAINLI